MLKVKKLMCTYLLCCYRKVFLIIGVQGLLAPILDTDMGSNF
jgi:hypothetical protein